MEGGDALKYFWTIVSSSQRPQDRDGDMTSELGYTKSVYAIKSIGPTFGPTFGPHRTSFYPNDCIAIHTHRENSRTSRTIVSFSTARRDKTTWASFYMLVEMRDWTQKKQLITKISLLFSNFSKVPFLKLLFNIITLFKKKKKIPHH